LRCHASNIAGYRAAEIAITDVRSNAHSAHGVTRMALKTRANADKFRAVIQGTLLWVYCRVNRVANSKNGVLLTFVIFL